jgi:hypothetical protein
MSQVPSIGEVVSVADVETVVRLDSDGLLAELVPTGDVETALRHVVEAATGPVGGGFFVVGPFGSGKSHLLSAAGELLRAPLEAPGNWPPELAGAARAARRSLPLKVPLVEYRAEVPLEDVARERAWKALGAAGPAGGADRSEHWDLVLAGARDAGFQGIVVLLDELSEWLRAKRGADLTEDLRFLQFLGEWAGRRPAVVLAALQENIEEVANVSEKELTRIRDRYRDLRLSMRHVEDLVRGRLVRLHPGAEEWVEKTGKQTAASFPGAPFDQTRMARCYPLHPSALDLLEGLRFLLSQNRGVVDFVCSQVRAELEAPATALVTPDRIWDHFAERLAERRQTAPLASAVVPYYERAVAEMFEEPDRELALRTVKLLCLLSASPLERPRNAAELAGMLLAKVSETDPAANVAYLEQVILTPLVGRGAYIVENAGEAATYSVEAGADAAVALEARLAAARAELNESDRRMVATLVELGSSPNLPLDLMKTAGPSKRELSWQNTRRHLTVLLARVAEWSPADVAAAVEAASAAGAEGALVVSEAELDGATELIERAERLASCSERLALWVPAVPLEEEAASLIELHSRKLVREQATREGRADLVELLERSRDSEAARAKEILARLYFSGSLVTGAGASGTRAAVDLPSLAGLSFDNQLPRLAAPLLGHLHPLHSQVAPQAELGQRHVQALVNEFIAEGRLGPAALQRGDLRRLIELYLVPLGVARQRKDGASVAPDPARGPAVAELLRLVGEGEPVPGPRLVSLLAAGPLGLTEPETLLLLNACTRAGLVERWRGRKKMAETFLAVTSTDAFGPGELVEQPLREGVAALAPAVTGPGPFEPWTAGTQRDAWHYAEAWLAARREDAAQVRSGLEHLDDFPALSAASTSNAQEDLRRVEGVLEACAGVSSPAEGLRALVRVAGPAGGEDLQASVRRLSALARFFRDDLRRLGDDVSYLTHPELVVPDDAADLLELHSSALALLPEVADLAAEGRLGELSRATREFRSAYVAAYQDAHDRHYSAVGAGEVEKLRRNPVLRALAALSEVGALAVPDGSVKVERLISSSVPSPCARRVGAELAWKPRCPCGFSLGDPLPVLDTEAVLEVARRGLRQQLALLTEPATSERLGEAAVQLDALGRAELAQDLRRLLELAAGPQGAGPQGAGPQGGGPQGGGPQGGGPQAGGPRAADDAGVGPAPATTATATAGATDPVALASLVGPELQQVLQDVLSGSQLIVTRDLAALREDLIGRRYTKRRLVELLTSWADPEGTLPGTGFIEVVDSSEAASAPAGNSGPVGGAGQAPPSEQEWPAPPAGTAGASTRPAGAAARTAGASTRPAGAASRPARTTFAQLDRASATVSLLKARFPSLAATLPAEQAADAFWLAAWWAGRPNPPSWVPRALLEAPQLDRAAEAARTDLGALAELADLDSRCGPGTVLGNQLERALGLDYASLADVAGALGSERLLRHPVALAAEQLARRLPGDWQGVAELEDTQLDLTRLASEHFLIGPEELDALGYLLEAARHLAVVERRLPFASCAELAEHLYPEHIAPVANLVSRAALATAGRSAVSAESAELFRTGAHRLLAGANTAFAHHAEAGFPGCLSLPDVGHTVIEPLLEAGKRVAVILVDAMRADAGQFLAGELARALPGRRLRWHWAVVPAPTRTAEAVASLALGRPVPRGSVSEAGWGGGDSYGKREAALTPFEHLGYEVALLKRADRDHNASQLRELWASASPVMVAVASALDERLHHSSLELAVLLDDAVRSISQRIFASLSVLPLSVPVVLLADHGFRENPAWGKGPEGRYVHGGTSLEECVVPVIVAFG